MHFPHWPRRAISGHWVKSWCLYVTYIHTSSLSVLNRQICNKHSFSVLCLSIQIPKTGEEYDLRVPRDMAYIFSGAYIPLSCKLIEQVGLPWIIQLYTLFWMNIVLDIINTHISVLVQVLERDSWTGLEEVTRLLNGHEFAVTGPEKLF